MPLTPAGQGGIGFALGLALVMGHDGGDFLADGQLAAGGGHIVVGIAAQGDDNIVVAHFLAFHAGQGIVDFVPVNGSGHGSGQFGIGFAVNLALGVGDNGRGLGLHGHGHGHGDGIIARGVVRDKVGIEGMVAHVVNAFGAVHPGPGAGRVAAGVGKGHVGQGLAVDGRRRVGGGDGVGQAAILVVNA